MFHRILVIFALVAGGFLRHTFSSVRTGRYLHLGRHIHRLGRRR